MRLRFPERLKKPGYRYLAAIALIAVFLTSPRWATAAMHRLTYFHVRSIEIRGVRYLEPEDVVSRLRVDTLRSIVDDVTPLEARLRRHPQIADVHITRRFPGTLIVTIRENLPVALVPAGDGMQPYDSAGRPLPIDPTRAGLDLPVLTAPDRGALRLLGALRNSAANVYSRISEVAPQGTELVFTLTPDSGIVVTRVLADEGVAPDRFEDIFPVESDLARRNERVAELDLRYRDQVVARLQ